jgi:hypothetical protein
MPRKKVAKQVVHRVPPVTSIEPTPGVVIQLGGFVRYYVEGWRYGHLESIKGQVAKIRPIGPKNAAQPNAVKVPLEDITAP